MVAVDIMEDLRQQRETLLHARDSGVYGGNAEIA
jgi:hypothetical protein